MTDPWADVREYTPKLSDDIRGEATYDYVTDAELESMFLDWADQAEKHKEVLTDADALLTVARAAQKMGGAHTRETIQAAWDKHLAPVLSALPEHLK